MAAAEQQTSARQRRILFLVAIESSVPFGLFGRARRTGWHLEGFKRVRMARVESRHVVREEFGDGKLVGANSFEDTFGQFVAAVIVVMGAVLKRLVEICSQRGVQGFAHGV